MEKAISSTRVLVSEIEKDAIRAATAEHNKELPLTLHHLTNNENVHHSVQNLYLRMDSSRARRRVYTLISLCCAALANKRCQDFYVTSPT